MYELNKIFLKSSIPSQICFQNSYGSIGYALSKIKNFRKGAPKQKADGPALATSQGSPCSDFSARIKREKTSAFD